MSEEDDLLSGLLEAAEKELEENNGTSNSQNVIKDDVLSASANTTYPPVSKPILKSNLDNNSEVKTSKEDNLLLQAVGKELDETNGTNNSQNVLKDFVSSSASTPNLPVSTPILKNGSDEIITPKMSNEDDLLMGLLEAAEKELDGTNGISKSQKVLKEIEVFSPNANSTNLPVSKPLLKSNSDENSILKKLHEDLDSSDEEDERNFEDQKYNSCGREIKNLLKNHQSINNLPSTSFVPEKPKALTLPTKKSNSYLDPIFYMNITNPVISIATLKERMQDKKAIPILLISKNLAMLPKYDNWVFGGVVCSSLTRTSQKGNKYTIWVMSDLLGDIKTVSVFLFSSAHKQYDKTPVGTIVAILSAGVLEKKESNNEATLSVDNAQKIMVLGESKDFGFCKSTKKNGDKCKSVVNKSKCEYCLYHMKQEYQKCSMRSEFQSNFGGKGLVALRNKVLGKNEVFYAGKSYTAIKPAKKSEKLRKKDDALLHSLSGAGPQRVLKNTVQKKKAAANFEVTRGQRLKDLETLKKLGLAGDKLDELKQMKDFVPSSDVTLEDSKNTAMDVITKLKEKRELEKKEKAKQVLNSKNTEEKVPNRRNSKVDTSVPDFEIDLNVDFKKVKFDSALTLKNLSKPKLPKNEKEKSKHPLIIVEEMNKRKRTKTSDPKINLTNVAIKELFKDPSKIRIKTTENDLKNDDFSLTEDDLGFTELDNDSLSNYLKTAPIASLDEIQAAIRPPETKLSSEINTNLPSPSNSSSKSQTQDTNKANISSDSTSSYSFLNKVPTMSINAINKALRPTVRSTKIERAKLKAVNFVQQNGPIKKIDPNSVKSKSTKRKSEDLIIETKKPKIETGVNSERFKKIMEMTSNHQDLLEQQEELEKEKYFNKLEKKEQLEEKMATTFKAPCKAVQCLVCKYTSFSAADRCKEEKHRLKVFDTFKRFFKCGHCGNRTTCLDLVPRGGCNNCGSAKWEKTAMIQEKIVTNTHVLSIRGGEQAFTNSVVSNGNLDLLVPDDA